jgi:hypothetical protein
MFDAFEYFYMLWTLDNNIKFVIINNHNISITRKIQYFISIINDKYNVDEKCFNNMYYINTSQLPNYLFNKCLVLDNETTKYLDNSLLRFIKCTLIMDYSVDFDFKDYFKFKDRLDIQMYNDNLRNNLD